MDEIHFNTWVPVVVPVVLSAVITLIISNREQRKAKCHELYKESLHKISLLLNDKITKENYNKICEIRNLMSKKYLTRKITRSLNDIIYDYKFLLDKHSYYQDKACAFLSVFRIELQHKKTILNKDLVCIEDQNKTEECLNEITSLFEQNPFLYVDNDIDLNKKAVMICAKLHSQLCVDLDNEFIHDCRNQFIRNRGHKNADRETYLESKIIDIQFVQHLRVIKERFDKFSNLCEKYN